MTTLEDGTTVASPGEPAYDDATQVFNLAVTHTPAAAGTASTVDDVRSAIAYAQREGIGVRVHSTGHAAASGLPVDGSLLVRTKIAGAVEIDTARRIARVPAGTQWGAVIDAAAAHGLAAPHGSSPLVGVVGYLLRGGVSFYGRAKGLGVNCVRAIELVTADGEPCRVDEDNDPELFWALRGGGGGFGVVTALEIELFPATSVLTGATYWSAVHAEEILTRWLRWTRDAPPEATTSLRVMNLPQLPEIPAELSAGPVICVDGAVLGAPGSLADQGVADDLLAPLRAVGESLLDTWHAGSPPAVAQTHMDPTEPFPVYGDHMLLDDLGTDGAADFLRLVGVGSGSPLVNAELRQLGGALSVPAVDGGVLDHLDARFAYMGGGVPFGPVTPEAIHTHCAAVREVLTPWSTGRTAPTFVDHHTQPQAHLSPQQIAAVDEVRLRVDPAGLFRNDITTNATMLS
jgi:FAD/FMN-containing dehydrogenase